MATALDGHLALIGFMGAGKTTLGREVAERLDRPFVDLDEEVERRTGKTIPALFESSEFRTVEERVAHEVLAVREPQVIALGGGTILADSVRQTLRRTAVSVLIDVEPDVAWRRAQGSYRPLAQNDEEFHRLFHERRQLYEDVADARADDADGAVLAAGAVHVGVGSIELLGELVPDGGRVALVADARVAGIHGPTAQVALAPRLAQSLEVPPGEQAKTPATVERLWNELRLERRDTLVAFGGGCTTDAAGFAAATYMRGIDWAVVPTTLVGQVDAAIGGKTAIDLPQGKNLAGAFHWPAATVIDPALLETLPERERRNGLAEVVKTGLLAGEPYWELPDPELVRRCAAYKTAICLRDPHDRGPRQALNLGHTFAHALETAAGYELPHGEAVALGLLAALRLSGLPTAEVDRVLAPRPVRVDRDLAWAALGRDKKASGGRPRFVLLEAPGKPVTQVELPEHEVRTALDELIAG